MFVCRYYPALTFFSDLLIILGLLLRLSKKTIFSLNLKVVLDTISPNNSLPHHHPVGQVLAEVQGGVGSRDVEEGGDGLVTLHRSPIQPGIS